MAIHDSNDSLLSDEVRALLENGLDFLSKARQELEEDQVKFSVVSFWTAVEILLKVPLVHEHWTLVCSGKKVFRQRYLAGDFQSVTYDEACARLADVLEKPLSKETMGMFDKVRQHRNRVVHFYHRASTEADTQQIMSEQAEAWFALNRLLRDSWASLFGGGIGMTLAVDETRLLQGNTFYAEAKFRAVKPLLDERSQEGRHGEECTVCRKPAMFTNMPDPGIPRFVTRCLVCDRCSNHAEVSCPSCGTLNRLYPDGGDFVCDRCTHTCNRAAALRSGQEELETLRVWPEPEICSVCDAGVDQLCRFGYLTLCTVCLNILF